MPRNYDTFPLYEHHSYFFAKASNVANYLFHVGKCSNPILNLCRKKIVPRFLFYEFIIIFKDLIWLAHFSNHQMMNTL